MIIDENLPDFPEFDLQDFLFSGYGHYLPFGMKTKSELLPIWAVNIFSIFSLGKDRSYLFTADIMMLGDIIGFHVFIQFFCFLYSLCHVRSLTFMFLNYIRGNKYNSPLDTRNYRLSAPHEINVT